MRILCLPWLLLLPLAVHAEPLVLDESLHHLRIDGPREWSSFPERPDSSRLEVSFESKANAREWTLSLYQQDVKQTWEVSLNGKALGRLERDENEMTVYFPIPTGGVVAGTNSLLIEQQVRGRSQPDDIRVGRIAIHDQPKEKLLSEATLSIKIVDDESNDPLPARITIINDNRALQSTAAKSDEHLAVRPGTIYTSDGEATFGVPAGRYTIYAGRGFEYSLAKVEVDIGAGEKSRSTLTITREVSTEGYVACDTHVHTLTHSGHGDATVQERMITLAAEGIELPIATDHNVHVNHDPFAREMNVRQYFTPVIGNEVTTKIGHFNVFPVQAGAKPPNHKLETWQAILDDIYRTPNVKIAILNHGRDLHSGVRPLGPKLYNDAVGENVEKWAVQFNAMEVVNSSATQSDPLQLLRDWMTLLNRGRKITPVGSSDSHDVARHFVGQGRTYIRCDDSDPGDIDVEDAVTNFVHGRVMVSYGLIAELLIEDKYRSGELARVPDGEVEVAIRVLGPHWVEAEEVTLYANGMPLQTWKVNDATEEKTARGVKWAKSFTIPKPKHDVHLVVIATGPGVDGVYWCAAKPYQPTSADWRPRMIGCSGAVWLDFDGDGKPTAARDYAERIFASADGELAKMLEHLKTYDATVAAQAAHLVQSSGISLLAEESQETLRNAAAQTRAGFDTYLRAWRINQQAARE